MFEYIIGDKRILKGDHYQMSIIIDVKATLTIPEGYMRITDPKKAAAIKRILSQRGQGGPTAHVEGAPPFMVRSTDIPGERSLRDILAMRKTPPPIEVKIHPEGPTSLCLKDAQEALERDLIVQALQKTRGNKAQAAILLGISTTGLTAKLDRYGINFDLLPTEDEPAEDHFSVRTEKTLTLEEALAPHTRALIIEALRRAGNQVEAAKLLGIARNTLTAYMKHLAIDSKAGQEASTEGPFSVKTAETLKLKEALAPHTRALIVEALRRARGNQTEATRLLGISRNTLALRLQELNIEL